MSLHDAVVALACNHQWQTPQAAQLLQDRVAVTLHTSPALLLYIVLHHRDSLLAFALHRVNHVSQMSAWLGVSRVQLTGRRHTNVLKIIAVEARATVLHHLGLLQEVVHLHVKRANQMVTWSSLLELHLMGMQLTNVHKITNTEVGIRLVEVGKSSQQVWCSVIACRMVHRMLMRAVITRTVETELLTEERQE